jgi:hypothetical protein
MEGPAIGPFGAWELWFLGVMGMTVGAGLFGLVTMRVATLSWRGAALLAAGSGLLLGLVVAGIVGLTPTWTVPPVTVLGVAASRVGWILLGLAAFRRDPLPPGTTPA